MALYKQLFSLYFADSLFVTDWRLDAILRMHKLTGADEKIITTVEEGSRLYGIKVYSRDNQKVDSKSEPSLKKGGGLLSVV